MSREIMLKARMLDLSEELDKLRKIKANCGNCTLGFCQKCNNNFAHVNGDLNLVRQEYQTEKQFRAAQRQQAQVQAPALAQTQAQARAHTEAQARAKQQAWSRARARERVDSKAKGKALEKAKGCPFFE